MKMQKDDPFLSVIDLNDQQGKRAIFQTYQHIEYIQNHTGQTKNLAKCQGCKKNRLLDRILYGIHIARGIYIRFACLNNDVSIDWYRAMMMSAVQSDADMVVGRTAIRRRGKLYFRILDEFEYGIAEIERGKVFEAFLKTKGRMESWLYLGNKLIRKELCLRAAEKLAKLNVSEMEDDQIKMLFVISVMSEVETLTVNPKGYCIRMKASTASASQKAYAVFEALCGEYKEEYADGWKSVWMDDSSHLNFKAKRKCEFADRILIPSNTQTSLENEIIAAIVDEHTHVVSFDVFDTLIKRNVFLPTDVFEILSAEINMKFGLNSVDFRRLRELAERETRKQVSIAEEGREDVHYTEIYQYMRDNLRIDKNIVDWAEERELELEKRICQARESGKYLYDLAQQAGKRVIICSDMYLPQKDIDNILRDCGYDGYELFVSNEVNATKASGTIFPYVAKQMGIQDCSVIVHIGDDEISDKERPKEKGWKAYAIPKGRDMILSTRYSSANLYDHVLHHNDNAVDLRNYVNNLGIRMMLGTIASHCFDSYEIPSLAKSEFSSSPKYIGYVALGPHVYSIAYWIRERAKAKNISNIHFVARDGYLPKLAFDMINDSATKSNYIRLSRKALLLADVQSKTDLYNLTTKFNYRNYTPLGMQDVFAPIIPADRRQNIQTLLKEEGLNVERLFDCEAQFIQCLQVYIDSVIDENMLQRYREQLKAYFAQIIQPGDYIFDIGYSGRVEGALSSLLGFPVHSFYIHVNNDQALLRQNRYGCQCECYYDYKPMVTGAIREQLLMEMGPSIIGFDMENGGVRPILEPYDEHELSASILNAIQRSALEFVKDFQQAVALCPKWIAVRKPEFSALYEHYMHYSKQIDRTLFECFVFEDDFGYGNKMDILKCWNADMGQLDKNTPPKTIIERQLKRRLKQSALWQHAKHLLKR